MSGPKVLAKFPRPDGNEARVTLSSYRDRWYVDFRLYFSPDGQTFGPTKKGLMFPADCLEELRAALDQAIAELESEG